jgi:hypothetical protein
MSDKENFVCMNCYYVGPLSLSGQCEKCNSGSVYSAEAIKGIASAYQEGKEKYHIPKELKWWHFVCGPFETTISNYRVKDLEEAKRHVCSHMYEWNIRLNWFVDEPDVTELTDKEHTALLRNRLNVPTVEAQKGDDKDVQTSV